MMEIRFGNLTAELRDPIDISVPMDFNGPQPNAYGVGPARSEPCVSGELIGDTRRGGSCNFERYTIVPHCNRTHTECVGHITKKRISVRECLRDSIVPAALISVEPLAAGATEDSYSIALAEADRVIARAPLEQVISKIDAKAAALIVRTLPNDESKLVRRYGDEIPPFFTSEAMALIVEKGFDHLVVDLPSVDRMFDEGKLSNHRLFWNVEPGKFKVSSETRMRSTITELAFVPEDVLDGLYFLNLQIAPFVADASPSRPLLYRAGMS